MLSDGTWTYTWEHGRELATVKKGSTTWTNTYNANGLRTRRSSSSATYSYVYNGGSLSQMTVGTNTLYFTYDVSGSPLAVTYNGTTYYYALNLQGDVMAILNASGTAMVTYTYDAWGNILTTSGTMSSTLGTHNPLRYRGYVYDNETELYYLQSRYYNPEWGRFINADEYPSTGQGQTGNNMFAYCGNNPVIRQDSSGDFWHLVAGGFIGGVIGGVAAAVSGGNLTDVLIGTLAGAAGGVLAASGAGVVAQAVGSAAISMGSNAASQLNQIAQGKQDKFDTADMIFDGAVGLVTGIWGGNGASYGNAGGIMQAGKQLFKRGFFNPQARAYYAKVAHRLGGEYVFKPLLESLGKNTVGSAIIGVKNHLKKVLAL